MVRRAWAVSWAARLVVAGLAGAVAGVSFEPYHLVYLLPVAVAILTLTCVGTSPRRGFLVGTTFGIVFMLVLLPWLQVIGGPAWIALSVLEGLFYGLAGLATAVVTRLPWWPLWAAATWVGVELLRGSVPFGGFPWGRLAFGTVDTPVAPLFAYTGPAGATLAVALVGTVLAWALLRVRRAPARAVGGLVLTCLVVSAGSAFPVDGPSPEQDSDSVNVAAVQGDVPGKGLEAFAERRVVLENHVAATHDLAERVRRGETVRPDLVVWPENSSDIDPYADPTARAAIADAVRDVQAPLLMGSVVGDRAGDGWHNRAIVWSDAGRPVAYYDKIHPVPFGEYIPFRPLLAPHISALDQIPSDMIPGTKTGVLQVGPARLGVLMCFEVAYDGLVRDLVDGGAQMVVVPTNNATYTGTGQIEQQFAMSRLRAIETGRTVVVASTNGISGIIAPDGHVVARSPVQTRDVLQEQVILATGITPGVRFGFWIEWFLTLVAAVSVSVGLAVNYRRRRRAAPQERPAEPVQSTLGGT
ncbi:MAG TPA: apolipoprotein N-acyltransferase [Nocardioidaceae bacterium]|nr:apolipoprotein N-acyltransferase [Nocardioidaceae bacterium]